MTFLKYPHLEKFGNEEVADIEFGTCYIFPKLDGTNASVWYDGTHDGQCDSTLILGAGSRNRELPHKAPDRDNAGFCAWVDSQCSYGGEDRNPLELLFWEHRDTYRLFGEWLVPHTVTHYREEMWRKFWIFDVWDETSQRMLTYEEYQPLLENYKLDYIPCIKIIKNPSYENLIYEARNCRFGLVNEGDAANKMGEGIVIKNYQWKNKWNQQPWAKIINSEFKDDFYAKMGPNVIENKTAAQTIADIACTQALVEKELAKIITAEGAWSRRLIPRLLHTVYYAVVTEELWNCLKKINRASVNFQELQKHCERKTKEYLPELF